MATFNLSRKLSHKPQPAQPEVTRVTQDWAQTRRGVKQQQAVKPPEPRKGWADGEGWTGSTGWADKRLRERDRDQRVAKNNAAQKRPRRISAIHGLEELGLDGVWRTVKAGRKTGRRKYEGYSLKTHHATPEVVPNEDDEARRQRYIKRLRENAPKVKPSKFARKGGKYAAKGSVYRPNA